MSEYWRHQHQQYGYNAHQQYGYQRRGGQGGQAAAGSWDQHLEQVYDSRESAVQVQGYPFQTILNLAEHNL
jgi:hypothetical protein